VSLCNAATTYDSKLGVFCDDCLEPVCVVGNDDFCGLQSQVSFCSEAGRTYYILVHGFGTASGPFQLDITEGAACNNPPSCEPPVLCPAPGDCCTNHAPGIGCEDAACCELVCGLDPYCCGLDPIFGGEWDDICAQEANDFCEVCAPPPPTGGCCGPQGGCTILTEAECAAAGGTYLGDGSSCVGGGAGNPMTYSSSPGLAIPDNGGPAGGVSDTINVPDSFTVGDVNVLLNIPHTWVGDLIVTLTHGATTVTVVDRIGAPPGFGCSNNDLNVEVDDQGSGGPIEAICVPDPVDDQFAPTSPPSYLPFATLSAFAGMDSSGDWTITVSDNAGFDTGVLASWSIELDEPGPDPCIPRGACCTSPTECSIVTEEQCDNAGGVYLGNNTECFLPGPVTVYSSAPGVAIPDNGGPGAPATDTISVPDSYTLTDVDIDFQTDHTWVGDLIIEIEHNGTTVVIVDRPGVPASGFGCNNNAYDIIVDDEGAGGAIENNCVNDPTDVLSTPTSPPNYTPNNPLSAFDGMNSAGDWNISVSDNAGFDTGSIIGWSVHLQSAGPSLCEDAFLGACCDGNTGLCTDGLEADQCVGDQRTFYLGQQCATLSPPCEQHRGACCDTLSGICTDDVLPGDCVGPRLIWSKGELCSQVTCVAAIGACCVRSTGQCTDAATLDQCTTLGGEWLEANLCANFDPPCVPPDNVIPTVSEWGLVVLALLLLVIGKVYFGARPVTVTNRG
jgi:subtilisin-like proprotein convertase family protein